MNRYAATFLSMIVALFGALLFAISASGAATPDVCADELYPPQTTSQLSRWMSDLPKGGVGCLHAGTYGDGGQVHVNPSSAGTSEDDRRKVRGYPGEPLGAVTINAGVYFSDSADYFTLRLMNVNGASLSDQTVGGPRGANNIYLSDLDITNESHDVIGCIAWGGDNLIVTRSRIHDCGSDTHFDHCIYLGHGANAQIVSNVIFDCAAWAIHLYPGSVNSYVHHNVLDSSGGGALFAGESSGGCEVTDYARVENNAITNMNGGRDHDEAVTDYWSGCTPGIGNELNLNCFWGNASGNIGVSSVISRLGNITANPMYGTDHRIPLTSACYPLVGDPASVDHEMD
jgi:hypothetical protein